VSTSLLSKVNPDPEQHAPVLRDAFISLRHHVLHGHQLRYGLAQAEKADRLKMQR